MPAGAGKLTDHKIASYLHKIRKGRRYTWQHIRIVGVPGVINVCFTHEKPEAVLPVEVAAIPDHFSAEANCKQIRACTGVKIGHTRNEFPVIGIVAKFITVCCFDAYNTNIHVPGCDIIVYRCPPSSYAYKFVTKIIWLVLGDR